MPAPVTSGLRHVLTRLAGTRLSRIVLGLDFDGTLAPIVVDPSQARPDAETLALLARLASRLLKLVIISGRDTDQLWDRLPIPEAVLIGNHGLEERHDGQSRLSPTAEAFATGLGRAADALAELKEARQAGVRVERKRAAISVHFRAAANPQAVGPALATALNALAARERLRLHGGRFVWELRPAVDVNKGTVVTGLARSLRPDALVYVGDDVTDADAFRAMRRLRKARTLAVGVQSAEVPIETFIDCDLRVNGIDGVKEFLGELLAIG